MGRLRKNYQAEQKLFSDETYYINSPQFYKGKWHQLVFQNNNLIEIEIGSGKGAFIYQKALKNPNTNFIAIDKYPTVLSKLLNKLEKNNSKISNLKIISIDAKDVVDIFKTSEIHKIYLNFTDPWPKRHHEKKRLTNCYYLNFFWKILDKNGEIEFKTDNVPFFNYTLKVIRENKFNLIFATKNLYNTRYFLNNIQTEYEKKWVDKNFKINKLILQK